MSTNHQMNYYDYGKTLDIQGVMPVIGGGVSPDTHEYVDLGLPSKTLWATENIKDADRNELYFAWGDTSGYTAEQVGNEEGKKAFSWEDYKFGPDSAFTKYSETDGKKVLDTDDDAAIANWGSNWKMPTKEQFEELISSANTTTAWTQVDGVNGLLCTSKANNNTLFFPAVGSAADGRVGGVGYYGVCWSVSLSDDDVNDAWILGFEGGDCEVDGNYRYYGCSVRPVRSNN